MRRGEEERGGGEGRRREENWRVEGGVRSQFFAHINSSYVGTTTPFNATHEGNRAPRKS